MATLDVTSAAGAAPANFLDVGGGASVDKVASAVGIILSDAKVRRVLVNVFGGILRCDIAAEGIVQAYRTLARNCPSSCVCWEPTWTTANASWPSPACP